MRGSYELPRVWSVSSSRSSLLHDCCWEESLRLNGEGGERGRELRDRQEGSKREEEGGREGYGREKGGGGRGGEERERGWGK